MSDLTELKTKELRAMADELKVDMKALMHINRQEALVLFRLFRRIIQELYAPEQMASRVMRAYPYLWN